MLPHLPDQCLWVDGFLHYVKVVSLRRGNFRSSGVNPHPEDRMIAQFGSSLSAANATSIPETSGITTSLIIKSG